jgi:superfamily II DNA helicase RecQ
VICAISAPRLGIDISDIRVIVHVDRPRNLLDCARESGRAGRGGKKSEAVILMGQTRGLVGEEKAEMVELVDRLLGDGKAGRRCRIE